MSMETVNPFARMFTPEPIIAQVRRTLALSCAAGSCSEKAGRDRVTGAEVRGLWGGRGNVFMPVLALREAWQALGVDQIWLATPESEPAGAVSSVRRRPHPHVLRLDDDVLAACE
jgi:hypothetical protein